MLFEERATPEGTASVNWKKKKVPDENGHGARVTEEYQVGEVQSEKVLMKVAEISTVSCSRGVRKKSWLPYIPH